MGLFLTLPLVGLVRLGVSAVRGDGRSFNWLMASYLTHVRLLVYGLLLMIIMLIEPRGLLGFARLVRPSLVLPKPPARVATDSSLGSE